MTGRRRAPARARASAAASPPAAAEAPLAAVEVAPIPSSESAIAVLRNRPFLLLWLAQVATQIGINMILYALEVLVLRVSDLSTAVSALFLTFLVPSVLFSAVAGVYVDRIDRRLVLVVTNALRAAILVAIFAAGEDIGLILILNTVLSTVTVFFAPAEAAMIPVVVPREQLVAANGIFTLTLNGAFAVGFAFLGPLVVTIVGSPEPLILLVAALFAIAAVFCITLPPDPPVPVADGRGRLGAARDAGEAVTSVFGQLREGISYIRENRAVAWSLSYLGVAASLIGVVAVLGPGFARDTLGLSPEDLIVVVLPLGIGIVFGVLLLNNYGKYFARRRAIELGLVALGILLVILTLAGPLSRLLTGVGSNVDAVDLSGLTSLVAVVVAIAFLCGVCYGIVAISAQVQLQEDIPADVRGRVFGVLNMLISVASILPIIIVGPIADIPWIGTTGVILAVAVFVLASGLFSIVKRGPIRPDEVRDLIPEIAPGSQLDPTGSNLPRPPRHAHAREDDASDEHYRQRR